MGRAPRNQGAYKDIKRALIGAQQLMADCAAADGNESETSKRVEHLFASLMGYDLFKHITHEYAIHGVGDTVHCDLAIKIDTEKSSAPCILIEVKRVNTDLAPRHLKQAASYAIDAGCEWVLLTNGRQWSLYRILFGQPPRTTLVESWNLIEDDPVLLAEKFEVISFKRVKKGSLTQLGQKSSVLTSENMLSLILSEESIRLIQRRLRKETHVLTSPEEIVGAVRRLLNEAAATEMDNLKISLPEKKSRKKRAALVIEERTGEPQALPPGQTQCGEQAIS